MPERLTRAARRVVTRAEGEALALGAPAIEGEHLLLALAADEEAPPTLAEHGLRHDRLLALLAEERQRSLGAAGLAVDPESLRRTLPQRRLRLGTSAKDTLTRAVRRAVRRRGITVDDLLSAVVSGRTGTVARLLALAGVDPRSLGATG